MYDNEKYGKMRDSGFSLFYMFINVGAIFAPMVAIGVRNWWLSTKGFLYNPDLPELCHGFLGGNLSPEASERFAALAAEVSSNGAPDRYGGFRRQLSERFRHRLPLCLRGSYRSHAHIAGHLSGE